MRGLWVVVCGCIGYVLSLHNIYLPLFLGSSLTVMPFFFVGFLLRKLPFLYPNKHVKKELIVAILLLGAAVALSFGFDYPNVSFRENIFHGNPVVYFVISILVVISFLLICKRIKWIPVISYIGRYSIVMLGIHCNLAGGLKGWRYSLDPYVVMFLVVIPCCIAIPFMIRYFPKFTAQKDLIRLPRRKNKDDIALVDK